MPQRKSNATKLGQMYDIALIQARAAAHEHGYALAVHGSEMRDLDLIAVPWVEECSGAEMLIEAIRAAVGGRIGDPMTRQAHGRMSWDIHLNNGHTLGNFKPLLPYLDISVMPTRRKPRPT